MYCDPHLSEKEKHFSDIFSLGGRRIREDKVFIPVVRSGGETPLIMSNVR